MIHFLEPSSPGLRPQDLEQATSVKSPDPAGTDPDAQAEAFRDPPPAPAARPPDLSQSGARCSARGCVFPAEENGSGLCFYHERLEREPHHFCSRQPTLLVLRQAFLAFGGCEASNRRARDRQRLAAQRDAFQQGLA